MKKRILSATLALIVVLTAFFGSVGTSLLAATNPDISSYFTFKIVKNDAAGYFGGSSLYFTKSTAEVYDVAFCSPKDMKTEGMFISWTNTTSVSNVIISKNGVTFTSGKIPLPEAGKTETYSLSAKVSRSTYTYTLNFVSLCSETTGSAVIDIDETFIDPETGKVATISAMNKDAKHNTSCYGTMTLDGKSYFIEMKGRGNYTWSQDKKPYNITTYEKGTFDENDKKKKTELISGVKSKKWSILANYADGSLLRNKIAYDMAVGLGIGLESRFIDVWMNGNFLGSYLLTPKSDYNAPDEGYVLELDNKTEDPVDQGGDPQFTVEEIVCKHTGSQNKFTVKANDAKADVDNEIQPFVQKAVTAVCADNFTSTEYLNYFDLDSWAKMFLLQDYYKSFDIISGSIFMYRKGLDETDKLYAGPIWDMDNSMGRAQICDYSGTTSELQRSPAGWYIDGISGETSLLQFLGKHKEFMERVYEIYNEYKAVFDAAEGNITTQKAVIATSAKMDYMRWPKLKRSYMDAVTNYKSATTFARSTAYEVTYKKTDTFDDFVTNLSAYVQMRNKFFKDQMYVEMPTITLSGKTLLEDGETLTLTASTGAQTYKWQSSKKGKNWDDIADATNNVFSQKVTTKNDGYYYRVIAKTAGTTPVKMTNCANGVIPSAVATVSAEPLQVYIKGDVNSDGNVDVSDSVNISLYVKDKAKLTEKQLAAANVNGDSKVDIDDAHYIAEKLVHIK